MRGFQANSSAKQGEPLRNKPVGVLRAFKLTRRGHKLGRGGRLRVAQTQRISNLVGGKLPNQ